MKRILFTCILFLIFTSFSGCEKTDEIKVNTNVITEKPNNDTENQDMTSKLDPYVGEYNDYDLDEPNLEIQKNEDGSYQIQIGVFRLTKLYDCVGFKAEGGIEFSTTEWGEDKKISGTITLEDDVATVTFTQGWFSFEDTKTYEYHKTADVPTMNTRTLAVDLNSYVGEYNDYDVDEPSLEIQKNEDGSYQIQIGIFRLTSFDHCIGYETESGIEFSTTEWGEDKKISGTITLEGDVATVTFTQGWDIDAWGSINLYRYHKTSDITTKTF